MPLGLSIGEFIESIRERIVVRRRGETWLVTAGSFESALGYARERFEDPVVLSRRDRARYWPRVTLEISMDPAQAAAAPKVEELAQPAAPGLPASLEAIFANQAMSSR